MSLNTSIYKYHVNETIHSLSLSLNYLLSYQLCINVGVTLKVKSSWKCT